MLRYILTFSLAAFMLAGCSRKIAFTNAIKQKYQLTEAEIKKIQFYTSEDIILYNKESVNNTGTDKGSLVVSSKSQESRILIKKGTPCIVEKVVDSDKLAVSFETGEGKVLVFGATSANGQYKLLADSWTDGRGQLTYGNQTFYASQGSGYTYLVFKLKKLNKSQASQKVVGGRKIN